jgi:hypothetical protein
MPDNQGHYAIELFKVMEFSPCTRAPADILCLPVNPNKSRPDWFNRSDRFIPIVADFING